MPLLDGLLRVSSERIDGPAPSYSLPHILLALFIVGEAGSIGRQALASKLGLGEGAIRTILRKLKRISYLKISPSGCSLTEEGEDTYFALKRKIPKSISLDSTKLSIGKTQVAIIIKEGARYVSDGIAQRDAAIKAGASGATTFVIRDSRFQIPKDSRDCEKDFPSTAWRKLRDELEPENGDAIIVCGSGDVKVSNIGAVSATLTLLR